MKFKKLFGRKKQNCRASHAHEFMLESLEPRLLLSATPMTAAVVTTDYLDYAPGETAVITSSSQAGELVRFQVSRTDGMADGASTTADVGPAGDEAWYVIDGIGGFTAYLGSDVSGDGAADWIAPDNDLAVNSSISTTWFVEEQYRNSSLLVTAVGQEFGAVATQAFTDAKINTTTVVSSTIATSTYGDTVTFTATVTPAVGHARPTGSVEFFDGTKSLGIDSTADHDSGATSIFAISLSGLTAGTHSIHAVFTGGAGHGSERAESGRHHGQDHRDRHRDLDGHRHDGEREESHRRGIQERQHHGHADHDESGKHSQYNSSSSGNLAQTVSQKSLTGSVTVANKVYDGNVSATLLTRALAGVLGGDDVNLTGGTAAFIDANAGADKLVTLTGVMLIGTAASNYSLTLPVTTTATIAKATATITGIDRNGSGYFGIYDGQAHAATATVTGVGGATLGTIASATTHTNAGTYSDTVTFLGDANYKAAGKTVKSYILQATATITVSGYNVVFDGNAHTATGTATGVNGEDLSFGLNPSFTTHTAKGVYLSEAVTFTGGMNYKDAIRFVSSRIS